MPVKTGDLHGNAPDQSPVVLLIIDVFNDLEFVGGEELLKYGKPMAQAIAALKRSARIAGIPTIYINDNFGKWRSDFRAMVHHCLDENVRGRPLAELLAPEDGDYFVIKPKHSGFFSTTLDLLLKHLGAKVLVLSGMATNSCVLFTAADAYLRDYEVVVPSDCVASSDPEDDRQALTLMKKVLKADIRRSEQLDLVGLLEKWRDSCIS